jgi:hypothetical protein
MKKLFRARVWADASLKAEMPWQRVGELERNQAQIIALRQPYAPLLVCLTMQVLARDLLQKHKVHRQSSAAAELLAAELRQRLLNPAPRRAGEAFSPARGAHALH